MSNETNELGNTGAPGWLDQAFWYSMDARCMKYTKGKQDEQLRCMAVKEVTVEDFASDSPVPTTISHGWVLPQEGDQRDLAIRSLINSAGTGLGKN